MEGKRSSQRDRRVADNARSRRCGIDTGTSVVVVYEIVRMNFFTATSRTKRPVEDEFENE